MKKKRNPFNVFVFRPKDKSEIAADDFRFCNKQINIKKERMNMLENPVNFKDIKTFNYFIMHCLIRMFERDPEEYVKEQIKDEMGERWQPFELIKLSSESNGYYLRFVFHDGKTYEIKINEVKDE